MYTARLMLTGSSLVGIRRQHRHSVPRDISEERFECRTSFLDNGPPNQGEDGHYDRQQQANGASRPRPRCAVGFRGWMLLNNEIGQEHTTKDGWGSNVLHNLVQLVPDTLASCALEVSLSLLLEGSLLHLVDLMVVVQEEQHSRPLHGRLF